MPRPTKQQLALLLETYRDVEPTQVIVLEGLDQLYALQQCPAFKPTPLGKAVWKRNNLVV
jgi:hypothetical protein